MLMSGIGSYAPQYMSNGGGVPLVGGSNPAGLNFSGAFSYDALTEEQKQQLANMGIGYNVTGATGTGRGGQGGAGGAKAGQGQTPLPSYLYFDGNMVVPYRETNNRQMIDTLRLLGLVSDEDYAWFSNYFKNERGDATWLNSYFNRPDENFQRERFFERTDFDDETDARWNRIFDSIDAASKTGGFATDDNFLMQYTDQGIRSTFGAVRPMGGTPRSPFFTTSDVLVDSSEQPNLYTYNDGQFDPMTQPAPVNPYQTPASDLAYPYVPPSGPTPTLTATTADAQPVNLEDTQGRGDIYTPTATPTPVTQTTTPVTTAPTPTPTPFVDEELMALDDEQKSVYDVVKFLVESRRGDQLTNAEANQILTAYDATGRDSTKLQSLIAGDVSGQGNIDVDPGDVALAQGQAISSTPFVPTGGTGLTSTQAALKAMEERKAAEAQAGQFAMGGIVDLTGGMDMSMTGQGLETFLNPERSKATLRRNLAKTAPRPTMQTGIMPMAR